MSINRFVDQHLRWFLFSALALGTIAIGATGQESDQLILNSQSHMLLSNPLNPWLRIHPSGLPESDVISTARWRGYVATWKVINYRLYLTKVHITKLKPETDDWETMEVNVMPAVFATRAPVLAEWFSGYLIIATGRMTEYVHLGYASSYSRYRVLTVKNGRVTGKRTMVPCEFRAFRLAQFDQFKKTARYRAALKANKGHSDFVFDAYVSLYTSTFYPEFSTERPARD